MNLNEFELRKYKQDRSISLAVLSSFPLLIIQLFLLHFFNIFGTSLGNTIQLITKAIVGLLFLIALPTIIKRNLIVLLFTYLIALCIFCLNILIFPQNIPNLIDIIFPLFFTCLPSFIYSYSLQNRNVLFNIMVKFSIIVFSLGTVLGVLAFAEIINLGQYNMALSYYMLFPSIIGLYNFFTFRKIAYLLQGTISILVILALGSRGAILCIIFYIIIYLFANRPKLNLKSIYFYSILLTFSIFIAINLDKIISYLFDTFYSMGIRSRTLYEFTAGDLNLSGRDLLYSEIINQIKEHPLIGIGITGDRLQLGMYTHNIVLEMLSGFGIILGTSILLFILIISLMSIKGTNKSDINLMIIWISLGLIPLFVSNSYLQSFHFWIFLGLAFRTFINKIKVKT